MIIAKRWLFTLCCSAIALPGILGSPGYATGATTFAYSPLFCQTFSKGLFIYSSGQISNRGNGVMTLFCPLIHEEKFNETQNFEISVVNDHPSEKIRCRVFFNHPHAQPSESVHSAWHGQDKLGHQTATITIPGRDFLGGGGMIECEVPPRQASNAMRFDGESRVGSYHSGRDPTN